MATVPPPVCVTKKKKQNIIRNNEYFAKKMKESYHRNKPIYYIEIEGKCYVFKKDMLKRIKPQLIDTLDNPIVLFER